jgi:alpha-tubulin suppressor-like RCC1 family protein
MNNKGGYLKRQIDNIFAQNTLTKHLDATGYRIKNVGQPTALHDAVRLVDISGLLDSYWYINPAEADVDFSNNSIYNLKSVDFDLSHSISYNNNSLSIFNNAIHIDPSGFVGINNNDPKSHFDISGDLRVSGKLYIADLSGISLTTIGSSGSSNSNSSNSVFSNAHMDLSNGIVVAYGTDICGQRNIHSTKSIRQITSSFYNSYALTEDGTVIAHGKDICGELAINGLTDVQQIAVAEYNSYALKTDGTVAAFGCSKDGLLDIDGLNDVISIVASSTNVYAILSDRTVKAYGENIYGVLSVSGEIDVIQIAASPYNVHVLKKNGIVRSYGDNTYNQLSISGETDVIQIASSTFNSYALLRNRTVKSFGSSANNMLDISSEKDIVSIAASMYNVYGIKSDGSVVAHGSDIDNIKNIKNEKEVVQLSSSMFNTYGLKIKPTLHTIGLNYINGQLGINKLPQKNVALDIQGDTNIIGRLTATSANIGGSLKFSNGTTLKANGSFDILSDKPILINNGAVTINNDGNMGIGKNPICSLDISGSALFNSNIKNYYIDSDKGKIISYGKTDNGLLDLSSYYNIVQVAASPFSIFILKNDGFVEGKGQDISGTFGITGLSDVAYIAASEYNSYAIKSTGEVRAFGSSEYGTLNVDGQKNVILVVASTENVYILKSDGTVRAYGDNEFGQLSIDGETDVIDIAASLCNVYALTKNGTVKAYGNSDNNILDISGLTDVIDIAASVYNSYALKKNGVVVAFGDSANGLLNINGLNNVAEINATIFNVNAILNDGTIKTYGAKYDSDNDNLTKEKDVLKITGSMYNVHTIKFKPALYSSGISYLKGQLGINKIPDNKYSADINGNMRVFGNTDSLNINVKNNLNVTGSAFITAGGWTTTSDMRVKKDIENANNEYLLNMINEFPIYKYKWSNEYMREYTNETGESQYGTIAQNLLELSDKYPELKQSVHIKEHSINGVKYDNFHTINDNQYTYMLIGAVKQLITENNKLKQDIEDIKKHLNI